jgi:hypothetical protein
MTRASPFGDMEKDGHGGMEAPRMQQQQQALQL